MSETNRDDPQAQRTLYALSKREARGETAGVGDAARGRTVRRAEDTSDVRRFRGILVATFFGAGTAAAAALALPPPGGLSAPGPLSRPHVRAKLECTNCHTPKAADQPTRRAIADAREPIVPNAACVGCHGPHPSTRAGHLRLASAGTLGCPSCHTIHRGDQGVAFAPDAVAVRFAPGVEAPAPDVGFTPARPTTVAVMAVGTCAACHDPSSTRDPIARCLLPGQEGLGADRPSVCFDEHQLALPGDAVNKPALNRRGGGGNEERAGVCSQQHTTDRAIAWEAGRAVVAAMPTLPRPSLAGRPWAWIGAGLGAAFLAFAGVRLADALRERRRRRAAQVVDPALLRPAPRMRLPQIDVSTCLGCYACVDACPYDVLEIERYVAVVARPEACCGLTLCEQRCPNGSLKITDGDPIGELPRIGDDLASLDVPGLYLAGDVSGLPLIKNAIAQGAHAVSGIVGDLRRADRERGEGDGTLDLIIIGAGPAGISAALRARELGLAFEVVEQGSVAQSIRSFPRGKLIFDQPLELPVTGQLWLKQATKEELLAQWLRIVRQEKLPIFEDTRMTGIGRDAATGSFLVTTEPREGGASTVRHARRVLLAIGQRGTPRRLPFELGPEVEVKVHYHLADARSFEGQRVLVVGLGDVAMEAAIALGRQPGTEVRVAYRGAGFRRGKTRNIEELRRMSEAGRVMMHWEAEVTAVTPSEVTLGTPRGPVRLPNDAVLVLIGAIPPWDLLRRLGVRSTAEATARDPAASVFVQGNLPGPA